MSRIALRLGGRLIEVEAGVALREVADEHDTPLLFSCREGACGTCLIQVSEGADQLSPLTDEEEILLPVLADGRDGCRLACQVRVLGPAAVEPG